jgi:hypothetical protein
VDGVVERVFDLLRERPGFLSALRVGLPDGEDPNRWESALEARLLASGIEFVDLTFARCAGARPEVLGARFEPLPED